MVTSKQFTIAAVQTAVFTPEHTDFGSAKLIAAILKKFPDRFQGELQALPMPHEVPPEIPRIVLQSTDKTVRLEAGPARINCHWNPPKQGDPPQLSVVVLQCCELQEQYVRETGVRVGRVALVLSRICRDENPAQSLVQRFCNAESQMQPFNRSANFEIHNHKEYKPAREGAPFVINSWVRCKSGTLHGDGESIILVEQDLNTLATDLQQRRFDAEQIRHFFLAVTAEADDIFAKYFPDKERHG